MVVAFVVTTAAKGSGSNRVGGLNIHIYSDTACEPGWKLGSPSSSVEQWFPVGIFVWGQFGVSQPESHASGIWWAEAGDAAQRPVVHGVALDNTEVSSPYCQQCRD